MIDEPDNRVSEGELAATLSVVASSEALRFLRAAAAERGGDDTRETHISWVFLTQRRAFKLKKPVTLTFLDFSTLAAREQACRREVEINRAFAPELYLGIRPILIEPDGAMGFGPLLSDPAAPAPQAGGAAILDWVVEMRRFDQDGEFDALADRGALTRDRMLRLADRIAAAHRAAPKLDPTARGANWRATFTQICAALDAAGLADAAAPWRARAADALRRVETRLEARRRHGFVRRLHGDLHLGNICLLEGEPTPFDAIEFNEDIATIDPLYDLAFTAMDLLWRGAPELAQSLLSRYLGATRDYGGLIGWPFFLSLRAAIRAMTAATKGDRRKALTKLDFAARLLDRRPAPRLLVAAGLSGSGKSTLAAALAPSLAPYGGAVVISSDETRKRLFGQAPETPLPPEAYRPDISGKVYRRMLKDTRRALDAGVGVVLDGVFGRRADREAARAQAERLGVAFQGLWLETPLESRLTRVAQRAASSVPSASDAGAEIAAAQTGGLEPGERGWSLLPAGATPAETLAAARRLLDAARPSRPNQP